MRRRLGWLGLAGLIVMAGGAYAAVATNAGSSALIRLWLAWQVDATRVELAGTQGTLQDGMTLQGLAIEGPGPLPSGSQIGVGNLAATGLLGGGKPVQFAMRDLSLHVPGVVREFTASEASGSPGSRVSLAGVRLRGVRGLPQEADIEIQRLDLEWPLSLDSVRVVQNARIRLPGAEPVVVSATIEDGRLDGWVYSKTVSVRQVLDFIGTGDKLPGVTGLVRDVDVRLAGTLREPVVMGRLHIERLAHRPVAVTEAPVTLRLAVDTTKTPPGLRGIVELTGGGALVRQTALRLRNSRLEFAGEPTRPVMDVEGTARIADTTITVRLRGTPEKPDLRLSSVPPKPQGVLLVMLGTGKEWRGVTTALTEGRVTPELASEFIDYFLFGGLGGRVAQRLGIDAVALKHDEGVRGVEVETSVTRKLKATYGVEQTQAETSLQPPTTTHRLGAEYRLDGTSSVSLEGEKDVRPTPVTTDPAANESKASPLDEVFLKYKKQF
ncbi:MAG TPA: translocation/assembly module TamB domain-containing protein [bacterium]